jgi:hypothetical protein
MDAPVPTPKEPKTEIAGTNKTSPESGKPSIKASNRDDLIGWYKLPSRTGTYTIVPGSYTLIPVFKHSGSYWTVSWPGAEIPLKECPEGLEWALTPSSMEGTKIRFDKASNMYSIIIKDSVAIHYSDNSEGPEWQPVTKVNEPEGLFNPKAKKPRTNDDFLGWYQGVWLPVRFDIRKEDEKYIVTGQKHFYEEPHELKPLPDGLGFVMDERDKLNLTYNESLKRFELTMTGNTKEPFMLRIPLARIPATSSPEADAVPFPMVRIGIPSWH